MCALALTFVHVQQPTPGYSRVSFDLIPGVGGEFMFPALTTVAPQTSGRSRACPADRWGEVRTPPDQLPQSLDLLQTSLPWEADRAQAVDLAAAARWCRVM